MEIKAIFGDLTKVKVDAIVNPANSFGTMGGGVALAIKHVGGQIIEDEAVAEAPIPIGKAVLTSSGNLPCNSVIHSPTMTNPTERIGLENIRKATTAALVCALKNRLKKIAFPGMGTGVGGVEAEDAAKAMADVIHSFSRKDEIDEIVLVAYNQKLFEAFQKWIKK
ncbi:MAG: macro domain-containing protein [Candidatus Altiarchaeota archaeon]